MLSSTLFVSEQKANLSHIFHSLKNQPTFATQKSIVKRFRNFLPFASASLCFGFLCYIMGEVVLNEVPAKQDASLPFHLVFQAGHMDASNIFTRQAVDGEADVTDSEARPGTKAVALSGIIFHSKILSQFVPIRQNQLPRIFFPCGSRTLLYKRLII